MNASRRHSSLRQIVLVTGGAGYIGSHVVLELLLTGRYLPVVIDNGHNSKPAAIGRIEEIAREQLGSVLSATYARTVDVGR